MIASPSTSISLLERLASGDHDAWRRMIQLYSPLMQAWLRPRGLQPSDIDDLTQNALTIVVRKLPDYSHNGRTGAFRSWLRSIIENVLRDFVKSSKRQHDHLIEDLADSASDLNQRWDREHDLYVLRGLMGMVQPEFAPTTWQAFRRTALDGESPTEVAVSLGISVNAVHLARSRVLARLRREADGFLDTL